MDFFQQLMRYRGVQTSQLPAVGVPLTAHREVGWGSPALAPAVVPQPTVRQATLIRSEGPPSSLEERMASARAGLTRESSESEMRRILQLPVRMPMLDEEVEEFCRTRVLSTAFSEGFRLFRTQAESLSVFEQRARLLAPIGVGWGKTLLSLMIAQSAWERLGFRKIILTVPPEVLAQFANDLRWARMRVPFHVPVFVLGGRAAQDRKNLAASEKSGMYVLPYSLLQVKDTDYLLSSVNADLWIADEAHRIARRDAARTRRVIRYLFKDRPDCIFVPMSGTLTQKSVADYYWLALRALGDLAPLPREQSQAMEWAAMIDSTASFETDSQAGPLSMLCDWARSRFPQERIDANLPGFRKAYRLRFSSSPCVVSSGDADIGVSLILHNEPASVEGQPGFVELQGLMSKVENEWETPNGDKIEHAIHMAKWMYELAAGFYNRQYWPLPSMYARDKGLSEAEAEDRIGRAKVHHAALQSYHSDLRGWLSEHDVSGLDTPFLIAADMHRNGDKNVGPDLYASWRYAKDREFAQMPERYSEAVLVCPYKINAAVRWAVNLPKGEGGIIWHWHTAIGAWLREALRYNGIDALYCPAGADAQILDTSNASKVVIASISAHSTGKNLQHHRNQMFVEWPRSARTAEQVLGRVHRNGQAAEEIVVWFCRSCLSDELWFAGTLNDALYIQMTTGARQKLIYATHDPLPTVYSPETLRMRGMEPSILDAASRRAIQERFGTYRA